MALGADGRSIFEELARRFPDRFVDVGIAESSLIGVAAGLARAGKVVVVSAIASFLLRRAYEQIRVDVADPGLPVKLVGVGGGLSYGTLGPTHHMVEDLALTRTMPNMAVFVPCDASQAQAALRAALDWPGPAYVRLGTGDEPLIHLESSALAPGEPEVLRSGEDLLIFATGGCVREALQAADELAESGLRAGVVNVHTFHPWRRESFQELLDRAGAVLVVEEHSRVGGLGDALAGMCCGRPVRFAQLGIRAEYPPVGARDELLFFFGLDRSAIVRAAVRLLGNAP